MSINHFQINLTSPYGPSFGFITLDGKKVFQIINITGFYNHLGYTDEIKRTGMSEEEFLWLEYRKDHCKKSFVCLQIKIIDYLTKNLASFKESYAEQCEYWLNSCKEMRLTKSQVCANCTANSLQE